MQVVVQVVGGEVGWSGYGDGGCVAVRLCGWWVGGGVSGRLASCLAVWLAC